MVFWESMSIKKIPQRIQEYGLRVTLFKIINVCMAVIFELFYGIDTEAQMLLDNTKVFGANKNLSRDYQAATYLPIRLLFNKLKAYLDENSTLVDYGCGKGRVLLLASEYGVKTIKGIDFSPVLCQIARVNIEKYKKRSGKDIAFQVIESDALDYKITAEDNIFFLNNPFKEILLDQLFDKIEESLSINPRFIMIIYMNPEHGHLLERRVFCITTKRFNFWSYKLNVYFNKQVEIG